MRRVFSVCLLLILKLVKPCFASEDEPHSRQKRLIWVTTDGRLALPPGTTLVVSPSLSLPFVRYPPDGFFSNLTVSLPFTIDFNKLGLTDNENPYGVLPPGFARSMGRAAGGLLADYVGTLFQHRRNKRSSSLPSLPKQHRDAFHGGERALLYTVVEDLLENFGLNGKACLLRAICEVHANSLSNYGFLGEIVKLFFTASKSPYSDLIWEYVEAENAGRGKSGSSECWPYMKKCPRSIFQQRNIYHEKDEDDNDTASVEYNSSSMNM